MALAKNICNCPNPPGGRAVCAAHQLAICRVKNGKVETDCIDPELEVSLPGLTVGVVSIEKAIQSRGAKRQTGEAREIANWVLSHITGTPRSSHRRVNDVDLAILKEGVFENAETGEKVTFRLPFALGAKQGARHSMPTEMHDLLAGQVMSVSEISREMQHRGFEVPKAKSNFRMFVHDVLQNKHELFKRVGRDQFTARSLKGRKHGGSKGSRSLKDMH